ncbi:hypothetical protein IAT40_001213 [Kwoniella sp. CBS 6097]
MDTSFRSKRARSLSSSSGSSGSSSVGGPSRTPSPPPKFHRAPSPTTKSFICVLPPTCSQPDTSTYYATQAELDRHQETFHKWVCHVPIRDRGTESQGFPSSGSGSGGRNWKGKEREGTLVNGVPESFVAGRIKDGKRWRECSKVFPDERLLLLHHTEVHDPIARQKKVNGQKIFECFLPPSQCGKIFIDPRQRRRHLIDKHKYPHQYFFSITNHGLNEIVRQDGLAISMIRPRRDPPQAIQAEPIPPQDQSSQRHTTPHQSDHQRQVHENGTLRRLGSANAQNDTPDIDMDDLSAKMGHLESSLTFVPRGVRAKRQAAEARNQHQGKLGTGTETERIDAAS